MQLKNKVALITGAASGIGKAIAMRFAEEGALVAVADLDITKANQVAEDIQTQGGQAMGVLMDVIDEKQVHAGVDRVVKKWGGVDVLLSNAGIQIIESIDKLPYDSWKKLISIHLDGAFLTTQACLKHMYASGRGGSIIYMGSVHSKEASLLKAPYVTAKHGLLGLCKVVAKEGAAHNVRANVICPGYVRTPLLDQQILKQAKALHMTEEEVIRTVILKGAVDGEFTSVEDVARTALFFASFPSNALTGQSLVVSHGWYME